MSGFISDNPLEKLKEIVTASGGEDLSSVSFNESKHEGRGVFCTKSIAQGQTTLKIPLNLCLSVESIQHSALSVVLESNQDLLNYPDEILCLGIMYSLSTPESPWYHHVQTFPKEFNNTLNWNDDELEKLRPCTTYNITKLIQKQIVHDWNNIHEPLKEEYPILFKEASLETYTWALSAVYSRAVGFHRDGQYLRVIPPLIDMANHNPFAAKDSADTFEYSSESESLCLRAASDLNAGDQCYAVYGQYPNSKLALNYGFVILRNPQQRIDLWTKLLHSSNSYEQKRLLLDANEDTRNQTYDFEGTLVNGEISMRLLMTIRIIQMTPDELQFFENSISAEMGSLISIRNERATYTSLLALLQCRLGHPDQIQADADRLEHALLGNLNTSDRDFMALVIRTEEREHLQRCIACVESWLQRMTEEGEAYKPAF